MKNSLMTFSLKEIAPTFRGPFSTVGINTFDIHEKHDLNREIRKTRGFMKTQGFRPSLWKWERFLKTTALLSNLIPPCFYYLTKIY